MDASGEGGGNIQVRSNTISLNDGSVILANTLGSKTGGYVILQAAESVILKDANIFDYPSSLLSEVNAGATGNGGNIKVKTGHSNPYEPLNGWYTLTGVRNLLRQRENFSSSTPPLTNSQFQPQNDRIVEAQAIAIAPDGSTMLVSASQLEAIANAKDLICQYRSNISHVENK